MYETLLLCPFNSLRGPPFRQLHRNPCAGVRHRSEKPRFVTNVISFLVFIALHGMQTRSSDENSVCLSVCPSVYPSVCQTGAL